MSPGIKLEVQPMVVSGDMIMPPSVLELRNSGSGFLGSATRHHQPRCVFPDSTHGALLQRYWLKVPGSEEEMGGLPRLLLTRVFGRCERGSVDCFIFDWREYSLPSLLSPTVVGSLDPGRDGQPEFLPGGPPLTIQDVLRPPRLSRCRCVIPEDAGRGRHEELSGDFDADSDAFEELGCEGLGDGVDELVQVGYLVSEFQVAAGQGFHCNPVRGDRIGRV